MAITNYLVHFKTEATYELNKDQLRNDAVAFVKDATIIHTHGTDYYCGSGPVALKSELSNYATTSALTSGLAGKANTSHTHTISQISGLQTELNSKLESVSLADLGITATATELNYVDGVTSNIQTQLNGKANTSALSAYLPLAGGTMSGTLTFPTATQAYNSLGVRFSGVSSRIGASAAGGLGLYAQDAIYLRPSWTSGGTSYGLVVSASDLTYNGYSLLYSANYTSYTVTKTGGGASGTWNINISGTAASANSVAWNNVSGKPSSFTPSSHTHTASQVSGLAKVATSGSYNDLSNKPTIPSLAGYATQSWVQSQGYLTTPYTLPIASASTLGGVKIGSGVSISSGVISVSCSSIGAATSGHTHSQYLTSSSLSGYATQSWVNSQGFIKSATDTKNTTGSAETSSKLFLVGAISQAASSVTYSNSSVYTQSGQLYATRMNATSGFFETSDARLKDFKEDIKALDTIDQIPTKYFTWKEDESKELQIGTSAQEVEKLYPELVSKIEDDTLTVDYAKLSIIALAAIKELKAEIQSLKKKLNN